MHSYASVPARREISVPVAVFPGIYTSPVCHNSSFSYGTRARALPLSAAADRNDNDSSRFSSWAAPTSMPGVVAARKKNGVILVQVPTSPSSPTATNASQFLNNFRSIHFLPVFITVRSICRRLPDSAGASFPAARVVHFRGKFTCHTSKRPLFESTGKVPAGQPNPRTPIFLFPGCFLVPTKCRQ
ncbi:hypothetical protein ZHAS_00015671 [Anopheles sinensis]|uniref:Uncharacterized protein n=1 Tax=Anopheles sinensis TaxID=74873 RepID=A0A084WBN6_ANOSI|nr:hypothetical protein ZHAS_00015671 [Anopheles sinensis]